MSSSIRGRLTSAKAGMIFSATAIVIALAFSIPIGNSSSHASTSKAGLGDDASVSLTKVATGFTIDDSGFPDKNGAYFSYRGSWEHVMNAFDGRVDGTSSRSFQIGAMATFRFIGNRFSLLAIKGPMGGVAALQIDGHPQKTLDFFSQEKTVDATIFTTPCLAMMPHIVEIVVKTPNVKFSRRRYVNLDGATYSRARCDVAPNGVSFRVRQLDLIFVGR